GHANIKRTQIWVPRIFLFTHVPSFLCQVSIQDDELFHSIQNGVRHYLSFVTFFRLPHGVFRSSVVRSLFAFNFEANNSAVFVLKDSVRLALDVNVKSIVFNRHGFLGKFFPERNLFHFLIHHHFPIQRNDGRLISGFPSIVLVDIQQSPLYRIAVSGPHPLPQSLVRGDGEIISSVPSQPVIQFPGTTVSRRRGEILPVILFLANRREQYITFTPQNISL